MEKAIQLNEAKKKKDSKDIDEIGKRKMEKAIQLNEAKKKKDSKDEKGKRKIEKTDKHR